MATTPKIEMRPAAGSTSGYATFNVGGQVFCVPVERVQDILSIERISPVPAAPSEVSGLINLRGRIVTVVDVRARLNLPATGEAARRVSGVTVECGHELYTLRVDEVGDVVDLAADRLEPSPATIDPVLKAIAAGVFRFDERLVVLLDIDRLLDLDGRG